MKVVKLSDADVTLLQSAQAAFAAAEKACEAAKSDYNSTWTAYRKLVGDLSNKYRLASVSVSDDQCYMFGHSDES